MRLSAFNPLLSAVRDEPRQAFSGGERIGGINMPYLMMLISRPKNRGLAYKTRLAASPTPGRGESNASPASPTSRGLAIIAFA